MQMNFFNGLNMSLGTLSRLSDAETRSISAENRSGAKGAGGQAPAAPDSPSRDLGTGWKCHAYDRIKPGEVFTVADIDGSGALQSMWMTGDVGRHLILRIYWDDREQPAVECPVCDFFGVPWHKPGDPLTPQYFPHAELPAGCSKSEKRTELFLGNAVPASLPDYD